MSSAKEEQIASLVSKLSKSTNEYDDQYSLKLCDQLLLLQGQNDTLALHCKVITLIRLERYNDALALIGRDFCDKKMDLTFEKLYCYYRTHQWQQAFDLLDAVKASHPDDTAILFVKAQLYYAKDDFQKAIDIYEQLIQEVDEQDPIYEEVNANLLAAQASLVFAQPDAIISPTLVESTGYEVTYNLASIHLAQGDYTRASELLEKARKQCNERAKDGDLDLDEMDEELAVIATQLAYTYQVQGRVTEAMSIYNDIVVSKIRDHAVNAVVANNQMALQKTDDLFGAAKKLKVATGKEADRKFKQYQKRIIKMNEALLQMYMNKHGSCKEIIQRLIRQYPEMDQLYVILASATYHHQKKTEKAIKELKAFIKQHPTSLALRFATIQLELLSSQPASALQTLENYLDNVHDDPQATHLPAVVALRVWLCEQLNQADKAMRIFDQALAYWKTTTPLMKQTAAIKLKTGRYKDAVMEYGQLVKTDPTDTHAIAGLVAAYCEIDIDLAEQVGQALPTIPPALDVDESSVKKTVKPNPSGKKPMMVKKKKRKPLLPQNYDPTTIPDPERWLRNRSTGKKKIQGRPHLAAIEPSNTTIPNKPKKKKKTGKNKR